MVFAFDTLSYARYLRDHGVVPEQAEAHAEATRQFVMIELVTKTDLQAALAATETRLDAVEGRLEAKIAAVESRLVSKIEALSARFDAKFENLALQLTVRLGLMLAAAIAVLAAIQKLS